MCMVTEQGENGELEVAPHDDDATKEADPAAAEAQMLQEEQQFGTKPDRLWFRRSRNLGQSDSQTNHICSVCEFIFVCSTQACILSSQACIKSSPV